MRCSGVGQARAPLRLEGAVDKDWGDQPPTGYLRISLSPPGGTDGSSRADLPNVPVSAPGAANSPGTVSDQEGA